MSNKKTLEFNSAPMILKPMRRSLAPAAVKPHVDEQRRSTNNAAVLKLLNESLEFVGENIQQVMNVCSESKRFEILKRRFQSGIHRKLGLYGCWNPRIWRLRKIFDYEPDFGKPKQRCFSPFRL